MTDAFSLLGVAPTFDLDVADLAERHKTISAELHPDRLQGHPATIRRHMLSRAIDVNAAFRKLKDPITRGAELALLLGIGSDEGAQAPAAPALLMQMMEWREELRAAMEKGDVNQVRALGLAAEEGRAAELKRLSQAFQSFQQGDAAAAARVQAGLGSLRYFQRFLTEQQEALLDMDP